MLMPVLSDQDDGRRPKQLQGYLSRVERHQLRQAGLSDTALAAALAPLMSAFREAIDTEISGVPIPVGH